MSKNKNDIDLVGMHIGGSDEALIKIPHYYQKDKVTWFQVFASSPMSNSMPNIKPELIKNVKLFPDVRVIFHSPYWVSLLNPEYRNYNIKYIVRLMLQCLEFGIPFRYVTHIGYGIKESTYEEKYQAAKDFLKDLMNWWPKGLEGTFFLETDSGYKGWNGEGGLSFLIQLVSEFNNDQVRICCDSEHVFASGEKAPRGSDWDWISLVHLNSIPLEVERGRFLDRHSFSKLEDCKIGVPFVAHYFFNCLHRRVPMILERRDLSISLKDRKFLRSLDLDKIDGLKEEKSNIINVVRVKR